MHRLRSMGIWGTTSNLGWLENVESVGGMKDRARKGSGGPLQILSYGGTSPALCFVQPEEPNFQQELRS